MESFHHADGSQESSSLDQYWSGFRYGFPTKSSQAPVSHDFLKKMYFAKSRILQLLLKTWFSALRRGLSNFWATDILNGINKANP